MEIIFLFIGNLYFLFCIKKPRRIPYIYSALYVEFEFAISATYEHRHITLLYIYAYGEFSEFDG